MKRKRKLKKSIDKCEICGETKWLALKKINGVEKAICKSCFENEMLIKRGECIPFRKNEIKNAIFLLKDYAKMLEKQYGHLYNTYSGFGYMTKMNVIGSLIKKLDRRRKIQIDEYCAMCGKKMEVEKNEK
jgi:transcription elongation factor Elf1